MNQIRYGYHTRRRRKRYPRWLKRVGIAVVVCVCLAAIPPGIPTLLTDFVMRGFENLTGKAKEDPQDSSYEEIVELLGADVVSSTSPQELRELIKLQESLEGNGEMLDFVMGYPHREDYLDAPIDLSADYVNGQVPMLMQWDKRWGYDRYGQDMIALSGCGPTCLTMAYLYFTGDLSQNPRTMAQFAYKNGYYADGGTSWDLWTKGAEELGLTGEELPLDQRRMEKALDAGNLIVCSMRPGDFTTTGHFILIYGYDADGFYLNDPNRRSNSEKQWSYDTLDGQIKNLWALGK